MRHLEEVHGDLAHRVGLWEGLCRHAVRGRFSHGRRGPCHCRAHLCGKAIVSGSVRRLAARRGLVVDFVNGCGARYLCCRRRGRLVVPAGYRGRGGDRVVSRCLTL